MAQITNRATLATVLTNAMDETFTNRGKQIKKIYPKFLSVKDIDKGQFIDYDRANFGYLIKKGEQEAISYDQLEWGNTFQVTADSYGLGFRISREAMDDMISGGGGYGLDRSALAQIVDMAGVTSSFRDSAQATQEDLAAQLILLANSTTVTNKWIGPGRDAIALAGTHTLLKNGAGTYVNSMTAAALSYYQLQSAYTILVTGKTDEGFYSVPPSSVDLIVGPYNQHRAYELIKSKGKPDTNENTPNSLDDFSWNIIVNPYLGSTFKGFAVRDPNRAKLYFLNRQEPILEKESDFEVKGMKYSVFMRCKVSFSSPFGFVHNAGA